MTSQIRGHPFLSIITYLYRNARYMKELQWIVTRVDGKIASIHTAYDGLARIATILARGKASSVAKVTTEKVSMSQLEELNRSLTLDDIVLYGTEFQKKVWTQLFLLSHPQEGSDRSGIISYSQFASICGNLPGIRAVAHAVGLNPIAYVIPCHWIVPKATIGAIEEAYQKAFGTIFEGADLYFFNAFDFGEYALGRQLKRDLLALDFATK